MGYQESLLYVEPQRKFKNLIRAYEKTEESGYYDVAGAQPRSVIILKKPLGEFPAGSKLLWICGDRCFHTLGGIFAGNLHGISKYTLVPVESVLDRESDARLSGIDLDSPCITENEYMKRYSAANYAHRVRAGLSR